MASSPYTVTANRLNLRAEPGVDSAVVGVLAGGTIVLPEGDLEPGWWNVRIRDDERHGYVARRYLSPLSAAAPAIPSDARTLLWTTTLAAEGKVGYRLGDKHSAQGKIDCSGWVCELTQAAFDAVNAAAAPEVVFERADFSALLTHSDGIVSGIERRTGFVLHGSDVKAEALRPGMLIGCDFGIHAWEQGGPRRVYGIDHIVQVIGDPASGQLWISQSSSPTGVNRVLLTDWLGGSTQANLRTRGKMHAVDPFLMADRNTRFVGLSGAANLLAAQTLETAPAAPSLPAAPAGAPGAPPAISPAAQDLIVEFEVSSRAHYEKTLIHPIWPKLKSGITIGIGHDLGFTTVEAFDRNWAGLSTGDRDRLRATIGKTGADARDCLASVKDIIVPWTLADAVYRTVDMPKTAAATAHILPNCDKLSGDCFGVLVSLSYNRGLSYRTPQKPGDTLDRYREMRAIHTLMTAQQFALIPAQIRAMKRIWRGTEAEKGLARRRDAEAALFEQGLRAPPPAQPFSAPETETVLHPETVDTPGSDESFVDSTEQDAIARALQPPTDAADEQADLVARSQVVWADDGKAIDYAHLQALLPQGTRFSLRAEDLERLHVLNAFPLDALGDRVLFGLRGCGIISATDEFADEVVLIDRRPDHQSARCVMGVWDRTARRIAVFPASTVPNAKAVTGWQKTRQSGNLLPTGFYRYITGTHNGKPGCLLLRKSANQFRTVIVRRSSENLRYERTDMVDLCAPGDNIHPGFFQTPDNFSSFGCQVVVGSATPGGVHSGPWSKFRAAVGLPPQGAQDGLPFAYMLLTGAEASLASAFRRAGKAPDAPEWQNLRRLRFGSHSEAVRQLQVALNLPGPDGDFGPNTSKAFHQKQAAMLEGACDGICSPDFAEAAGWQIF